MDRILKAALHALRSYQYGNVSPELAEMVADKIEGMEGTPLPSPFFAKTLNDSIIDARRAIRTGEGVNLALGRLEASVSGYLDAKDEEMPSLSVAERAILLLEQTLATRPEYQARGIEDYHRAWKIIEAWRGKGDDSKDLLEALDEAKAALVGDSNDAEHDALVSFVRAMGPRNSRLHLRRRANRPRASRRELPKPRVGSGERRPRA
jgi:hypothetical protein